MCPCRTVLYISTVTFMNTAAFTVSLSVLSKLAFDIEFYLMPLKHHVGRLSICPLLWTSLGASPTASGRW